MNEVCRRLHQAGIRTRTGKEYWDHKTVWDMLKNPAYKARLPLGKPIGDPMVRACACHMESQHNRDERSGAKMHPKRNGLPSRFLPWLIRRCLRRCKNNWRKTGGGRVSQSRAAAICCRDCWFARNVGMLIMGVPMMSGMPPIVVVARCACLALGANGGAGTRNCAWTRQMRRSGGKCATCWKNQNVWRRNIASVCCPNRSLASWKVWMVRWENSAEGSRASLGEACTPQLPRKRCGYTLVL